MRLKSPHTWSSLWLVCGLETWNCNKILLQFFNSLFSSSATTAFVHWSYSDVAGKEGFTFLWGARVSWRNCLFIFWVASSGPAFLTWTWNRHVISFLFRNWIFLSAWLIFAVAFRYFLAAHFSDSNYCCLRNCFETHFEAENYHCCVPADSAWMNYSLVCFAAHRVWVVVAVGRQSIQAWRVVWSFFLGGSFDFRILVIRRHVAGWIWFRRWSGLFRRKDCQFRFYQ